MIAYHFYKLKIQVKTIATLYYKLFLSYKKIDLTQAYRKIKMRGIKIVKK